MHKLYNQSIQTRDEELRTLRVREKQLLKKHGKLEALNIKEVSLKVKKKFQKITNSQEYQDLKKVADAQTQKVYNLQRKLKRSIATGAPADLSNLGRCVSAPSIALIVYMCHCMQKTTRLMALSIALPSIKNMHQHRAHTTTSPCRRRRRALRRSPPAPRPAQTQPGPQAHSPSRRSWPSARRPAGPGDCEGMGGYIRSGRSGSGYVYTTARETLPAAELEGPGAGCWSALASGDPHTAGIAKTMDFCGGG